MKRGTDAATNSQIREVRRQGRWAVPTLGRAKLQLALVMPVFRFCSAVPPISAPKGPGSPSPIRATPWGNRPAVLCSSGQRPNPSKANDWPVGPKLCFGLAVPQGVALGWGNQGPSAQERTACHEKTGTIPIHSDPRSWVDFAQPAQCPTYLLRLPSKAK